MFLDSGKFFGFWDVFWILGRVLDSGKCFGTYELSRILAPYGDTKRRDTRRQHAREEKFCISKRPCNVLFIIYSPKKYQTISQ